MGGSRHGEPLALPHRAQHPVEGNCVGVRDLCLTEVLAPTTPKKVDQAFLAGEGNEQQAKAVDVNGFVVVVSLDNFRGSVQRCSQLC